MDTVYILISEKVNRFYIGYTYDLEKKLEFHQSAKYNRILNFGKWVYVPSLVKTVQSRDTLLRVDI